MPNTPKIPDDNHLSIELGKWKANAKRRFAIAALIVLVIAINCIDQVAKFLGGG